MSTPWKCVGGVHVGPYSFSASAVRGGEWKTSCPSYFTPRERTLLTIE
jgi:hypothetical protein